MRTCQIEVYILLTFKISNKITEDEHYYEEKSHSSTIIKTKKEMAYILWKNYYCIKPFEHTRNFTLIFSLILFAKIYCYKLTTNCHSPF